MPTPAARIAPTPSPLPSWWAAGAAVVIAALAAILWGRRRHGTAKHEVVGGSVIPPHVPPEPYEGATAQPQVATESVTNPVERAALQFDLQPRRAGLNLLSATVEAELTVRNRGTATASSIAIGTTLTGAAAGQGSELATLFAQPVGRPAASPFTLAPGEERRLRLVVALPRAEIRSLDAGGRAMFVPVVAVNALYDAGGIAGQAATAFAIGIERVDSAKLAPLWLDQPPRMFDALGARPYGAAIDR